MNGNQSKLKQCDEQAERTKISCYGTTESEECIYKKKRIDKKEKRDRKQ